MAKEILTSTWRKPVELLFIEEKSVSSSNENINLYLKSNDKYYQIRLKRKYTYRKYTMDCIEEESDDFVFSEMPDMSSRYYIPTRTTIVKPVIGLNSEYRSTSSGRMPKKNLTNLFGFDEEDFAVHKDMQFHDPDDLIKNLKDELVKNTLLSNKKFKKAIDYYANIKKHLV